jgi:hypothetical protein
MQMNSRWFWENKFMAWIESKLLTFTNWFWNKRHQPPVTPAKKEPVIDTAVKKSTPKKAPAKRSPAKKKTDWNVKS